MRGENLERMKMESWWTSGSLRSEWEADSEEKAKWDAGQLYTGTPMISMYGVLYLQGRKCTAHGHQVLMNI